MKFRCAVLACSFFAILACSCLAEDYYWIDPNGGGFGESDNWNPMGVPDSHGIVHFTLPVEYSVSFNQNYYNDRCVVDGSDVTMDLGGYEYHLSLPYEYGYAVTVGENSGGRLIVSHGIIRSRDVSIGEFTNSFGSLLMSGADAAWTTSFGGNWHGVQFGGEGGAHLLFLNGAHFNHGHGNSAWGTESDVLVDVNGLDSEWYIDGQFDMSVYGDTTVNIAGGGLVDIGRLTMAYYPGSSAQINITGRDHLSELQLHSSWETSLAVGKSGHARIYVEGSKLWNQGSMSIGENAGSWGLLEIHEGSWVDCSGSVAIGGTLDGPGGTGLLKLIDDDRNSDPGVQFTPTSADGQSVVVWPQGTIFMDGGEFEAKYTDEEANPIILQGGTLEGNGMIWAHVTNLGGTVAPADDQDHKVLEIGFDYTQDTKGVLKITLGGPDITSQYSTLQVNNPSWGQVSLNGLLDVEFENNYVPNYDDQFIIISAASVVGTFSNAPLRYVFETGSFEVVYNADSVILTHYSSEPACLKHPMADINKDCTVDLADFAIFAGEWLECNLVPDYYCFGGPVTL